MGWLSQECGIPEKDRIVTDSERGLWLLGALLTELAAVLHTLGAVAMRRAAKLRELDGPDPRIWDCSEIKSVAFWMGLVLKGLGCLIWWCARCYAPDTTVAPLFLAVSFVTNIMSGPSLLHEQYHSREVVVAFACIFAVAVASAFDRCVMDPWPSLATWMVDLGRLRSAEGGQVIVCVTLWVIGFVLFVWIIRNKSMSQRPPSSARREPIRLNAAPIPVLAGLTSGATYFVGYVGFPYCPSHSIRYHKSQPSGDYETVYGFCLFLLGLVSVLFAVLGARRFDCRYFVPASTTVGFFTATLMRVLLVHHRRHIEIDVGAVFVVAHVTLLLSPFFVLSSKDAQIKLPQALKWDATPLPTPCQHDFSPFRHGTVDPVPMVTTPLLEIGDEQLAETMPDPEQEVPMLCLQQPKLNGQSWSSWAFRKWLAFGRALPALTIVAPPLFFVTMAIVHKHKPLNTMLLLAAYTVFSVGFTSLRVAVFSCVGRLRIQLSLETDYGKLFADTLAGRKRRKAQKRGKKWGGGRAVVMGDPYDTPGSSSSDDDVEVEGLWGTVRHFVVVEVEWDPGEAGVEELKDLLRSLTKSSLACTQVYVFLVIAQSGEDGNQRRSVLQTLEREFCPGVKSIQGLFCNSAWSTSGQAPSSKPSRLGSGGGALHQLAEFAKRSGFPERLVLVTFTTPDAVFQPGYFSTLTFSFQTSSARARTIWQPPVFPLLDYKDQPAITRHASMFLAESQLASLSDPVDVPLPQSTCSMPLVLWRTIDGNWEHEIHDHVPLQNTGIWTKCWLTTIGRSSVQPLFSPVLCRAMPAASLCGTGERRSAPPARDGNPSLLGRLCSCDWLPSLDFGAARALELMRVHSRGLNELVYFWGALLPALISGARKRGPGVSLDRLLCLFVRSLLPLVSITWAHVNPITWFLAFCSCTATLLLTWSWACDSKAFLLSVTALVVGVCVFPLLVITHVALIRQLHSDGVIWPARCSDSECTHATERPSPREFRQGWRQRAMTVVSPFCLTPFGLSPRTDSHHTDSSVHRWPASLMDPDVGPRSAAYTDLGEEVSGSANAGLLFTVKEAARLLLPSVLWGPAFLCVMQLAGVQMVLVQLVSPGLSRPQTPEARSRGFSVRDVKDGLSNGGGLRTSQRTRFDSSGGRDRSYDSLAREGARPTGSEERDIRGSMRALAGARH